MEALLESLDMTEYNIDEKKIYSVNEVFDKIDNKFIDFYGEYGRRMVNSRRADWNEDDFMSFKML
ncbi:MAG: hypothetical protein FWD66_01990 [Paludibacter sp.]|nr:hypothetical protein [Paludibacter sp.]